MLKQMRDGAKSTVVKFVLFGLLLLAMGGLALIGGGQAMLGDAFKDDTIVSFGRVQGHGLFAWLTSSTPAKISAQSLDNMVQGTLREQHMKQSDAYRSGLPHQVLREKIDELIFAMAADDAGLKVDEALAAKRINDE